MSKRLRLIILSILFSLLIICFIISSSYGYYVISSNEKHEMSVATDIPSCAMLRISDNNLISITGDYAVPLKDEQVLNSTSEILENFKYSFTVTNDCEENATMFLGIATVDNSSIPISSLKYVITESGDALPSFGNYFSKYDISVMSSEVNSILKESYGSASSYVYNFNEIFVPAKSSKEYDLYLWIDYNEGSGFNGLTSDGSFNAVLILNEFKPVQTKNLASYVTSDVYNSSVNQSNISEGKAGLYFHDSALENGALDYSYRFAGKSGEVNNFICFYPDDCTNSDNLYRIISIDSYNNIKVIKNKGFSKWDLIWNGKEGYVAGDSLYDVAMNLTAGVTYGNIWAIKLADGSYYTSSLNDYLNSVFLQSIQSKTDKIIDTTWSVGGVTQSDGIRKNVHDFMLEELDISKGAYTSKIGLMYAYEYGYAALPEYWVRSLYYDSEATNGYKEVEGNDWLRKSGAWTISRLYDTTDEFIFLHQVYNGLMKYNSSGKLSLFYASPTFTLSPNTMLINSDSDNLGTSSNPMLIF